MCTIPSLPEVTLKEVKQNRYTVNLIVRIVLSFIDQNILSSMSANVSETLHFKSSVCFVFTGLSLEEPCFRFPMVMWPVAATLGTAVSRQPSKVTLFLR